MADRYEKFRALRGKALAATYPFFALRPEQKRDVVDGICTLRAYEGIPILDYSKPMYFAKPSQQLNG